MSYAKNRSVQVELFLESEGVDWEYVENVSFDEIDENSSLANQARYNPINEEFVEDFATAIAAGAEFPAFIGYQGAKGKVIQDGNHRMQAMKRAGKTTHDMYLVKVQDMFILDRITRAANSNVSLAQPPIKSERIASAVYLVSYHNRTQVEAAREMNLPTEIVRDAVAASKTEMRLRSLGVQTRDFTRTQLYKLSVVVSDSVLDKISRAFHEFKLTKAMLDQMVSIHRQNKGKPETEQLQLIDAYLESPSIKEYIALTRRGKNKQPKITERNMLIYHLTRAIEAANSQHGAYRKQLSNPTVVATIENLLKELWATVGKDIQSAKIDFQREFQASDQTNSPGREVASI